jgi:hypothetical protein
MAEANDRGIKGEILATSLPAVILEVSERARVNNCVSVVVVALIDSD